MLFQSRQYLEKFLKIPLLSRVFPVIFPLAIAFSIVSCTSVAETPSNPRGTATWELKPKSVYDGDTFRVLNSQTKEELKIRLACIDAPEKKQAIGVASRDYLRSLLNRNPEKIILSVSNKDRYGRSVAEVYIPNPKNPQEEFPVNGEMLKAGMAFYYAQYSSTCKDNAQIYEQLEKEAKSKKAGVWQSANPMKPWEYRKKARE